MRDDKNFSSREQLDQAFHLLQDQITRITVEEEKEQLKAETVNFEHS